MGACRSRRLRISHAAIFGPPGKPRWSLMPAPRRRRRRLAGGAGEGQDVRERFWSSEIFVLDSFARPGFPRQCFLRLATLRANLDRLAGVDGNRFLAGTAVPGGDGGCLGGGRVAGRCGVMAFGGLGAWLRPPGSGVSPTDVLGRPDLVLEFGGPLVELAILAGGHRSLVNFRLLGSGRAPNPPVEIPGKIREIKGN